MLRCVLTWWLEDRKKAIDADPRQIDGENQRKLGGVLHLIAYTLPEVTAREALFTHLLGEERAQEMAGLISAREQELSQAGLAWRRLHNDEDVALSVLKRSFGFDGNPDIAFKKRSDAAAATTAAWGELEKAIQSW